MKEKQVSILEPRWQFLRGDAIEGGDRGRLNWMFGESVGTEDFALSAERRMAQVIHDQTGPWACLVAKTWKQSGQVQFQFDCRSEDREEEMVFPPRSPLRAHVLIWGKGVLGTTRPWRRHMGPENLEESGVPRLDELRYRSYEP